MSQRTPGSPPPRKATSSYTPPTRRPASERQNKGPNSTVLALGGMVVLLAIVVGAGILLNQNPAVTPTPTTEPVVNVWDFGSSTANSISVSSVTSSTVVEYLNGSWKVTKPVAEDAENLTVESVSGNLKTLAASRLVDNNPTDLGQYGLTSPALTVTVVLSGTTPPEHTLLVGNTNVGGSDYYVKTTISPTVYLVSNATIEPIKSWLETPPKAEPTPTPLPTPLPTITPTETISGTLIATPPVGDTPTP